LRLGVGFAFAFDAFTFIVSGITLQLIRTKKQKESAAGLPAKESVWASIQTGIQYLWKDKALRFIYLVMLAINFLLIGPIMVGIPVPANQRLPEGATAFGLLMSAFAGGNFFGYRLAGSLPRPDGSRMRWLLILLFAAFGLVIRRWVSSHIPGLILDYYFFSVWEMATLLFFRSHRYRPARPKRCWAG
jgi:Transmembrane secretion effector